MPTRNVRNSLLPLMLIAALAGCSKKSGEAPNAVTNPGGSGNGTAMTEAEVTSTLAAEPDLVEDGIAESSMEMSLDSESPAGATTAIRPLTFWRRIDFVRSKRTFEFAFADTDSTGQPTTAHVTVRRLLVGTFNVLAGTAGPTATPPSRDSLDVVHKPLEDHWVRHLLLKRVPVAATGGRGDVRARWRIAATSGVQVTSKDATTNLVSLRIQSAGLDTTITDPLALFRLRRVLRFASGSDVTITLTTGRNDDVALLYLRDRRFRLANHGDGTYGGTFRAGVFAGVRHFGVNALSHGTLFDDTAPYDSQAWILPYIVDPTQLAEYLP